MTDPALRDHFAAEALKALLSRIPSHLTVNARKLAEDSYTLADAMMRARSPKASS